MLWTCCARRAARTGAGGAAACCSDRELGVLRCHCNAQLHQACGGARMHCDVGICYVLAPRGGHGARYRLAARRPGHSTTRCAHTLADPIKTGPAHKRMTSSQHISAIRPSCRCKRSVQAAYAACGTPGSNGTRKTARGKCGGVRQQRGHVGADRFREQGAEGASRPASAWVWGWNAPRVAGRVPQAAGQRRATGSAVAQRTAAALAHPHNATATACRT